MPIEDNLESTNKDREIEKKFYYSKATTVNVCNFPSCLFFLFVFFLVDLFSLNGRELTACAVTLGFFA